MLKISEIFFSIQGESTFSGLPCIFVRLAGCNLRCNYCDTSYSYEEDYSEISIEEVINEIKKFDSKRVEITGGEPLLQEETALLIDKLLENDYTVLLETNGSIGLDNLDSKVIKIVDIKTPGSGCEGSFRMENIAFLNADDEIKFVLMDRKDFEWAKEMIEKHNLKCKANILLSPVSGKLDPRDLSEWILQEGLDVRLQLQLHKIIWGDERGR
ncbi:MAG: radical SAM protein [Thermodesulfobacteriota bacterium]